MVARLYYQFSLEQAWSLSPSFALRFSVDRYLKNRQASATFTDESVSGWQQAPFDPPVQIWGQSREQWRAR